MRGDGPQGDGPESGRRPPSGRTLLIAALIILGLGYFLSVKLREMGRLQDCVMSGRHNCAPITEETK